jgi:hypothetical protein
MEFGHVAERDCLRSALRPRSLIEHGAVSSRYEHRDSDGPAHNNQDEAKIARTVSSRWHDFLHDLSPSVVLHRARTHLHQA